MEQFVQCVIFLVLWKGFGKKRAKQNMCGNQYTNYCKLSKSEEQKRTNLEAEDYTAAQEDVTVDSHAATSGVLVKLCLLDIGGKWAFFRRIFVIFVGELHLRKKKYISVWKNDLVTEKFHKRTKKHWKMMLLWLNCK